MTQSAGHEGVTAQVDWNTRADAGAEGNGQPGREAEGTREAAGATRVVAVGIGSVWAALQKDIFHVHIGRAGESDARSSPDMAHINEIVRAMNESFIKRG